MPRKKRPPDELDSAAIDAWVSEQMPRYMWHGEAEWCAEPVRHREFVPLPVHKPVLRELASLLRRVFAGEMRGMQSGTKAVFFECVPA